MSNLLYQNLDIYTAPLSGTQLIEASAGTGKTWTIAGLYVRLLLESEITVQEILVVTFTKAATAELRERLRARLTEVSAALMAGNSQDPFCQWAIQQFQGEKRDQALAKIDASLRAFDESAIYTIHGFCQRVLSQAQFPEMLVEPDILPDEKEWLPALIQESWVRQCRHPLLAEVLTSSVVTSDLIQGDIKILLLKPSIELVAGQAIPIEDLAAQKAALSHAWQQSANTLKEEVMEATGLSRSKDTYREDVLSHMLASLESWLLHEGQFDKQIKKLTASQFEKNRKKTGDIPEDPFWQDLETYLENMAAVANQFRQTVIKEVIDNLDQHKRAMGLVSYQDLLGILARALDPDSHGHEAIADSIRQNYGAALIDEFQDTDPLQFKIFSRLFGGKRRDGVDYPLYLVGDPKQAIYSFRGADIFTYLRAKSSAKGRYSLDTNRRSTPLLVEAVNNIFSYAANPFLQSDLAFNKVNSVPANQALTPDMPPFQCWTLSPGKVEEDAKKKKTAKLTKTDAKKMSVAVTVQEIVRLLQGDKNSGPAHIGDKPLRPGDIAILVPKHAYAVDMANALAAVNIPAVTRSQDSVFATQEARDMLRVLEAIVFTGQEGQVKAALLTELWGETIESLHTLITQDDAWSQTIMRLLAYREQWLVQGFMAMWEAWLAEVAAFDRLIAGRAGERRITNLRHLSSLMQQQAEALPEPERLLTWLRSQVQEGTSNEDSQLRLESDAERVQILTIHVSKGLEYPVVFCPYLWDGALLQKHDANRAEYQCGDRTRLDIGSEKFDDAKNRMATERLAEKLRVLYVALTRAKYRCYGIWGKVNESETAAFTWLMLAGDGLEGTDDVETIEKEFESKTIEDYVATIKALADQYPTAIANTVLTPKSVVDEQGSPTPLSASANTQPSLATPTTEPLVKQVNRNLPRPWWVSSFTGLSRHEKEHEGPDHDHEIDVSQPPSAIQAVEVKQKINPSGIHAFKRGSRAGLFWHSILEDMLEQPLRQIPASLTSWMNEHDIDSDQQALVIEILEKIRDTPLGPEKACLGKVSSLRTEMEFWYPAINFDITQLSHLPDIPAHYQRAVKKLNAKTFSGFLNGFIDLIYCHEGRYYVMDYKTNWLGADDSAYTEANMQEAMAHSHYYLQFWLYTLALHRYLKTMLADYDYDRHIGGVRYLFIRGIHSATQGLCCERPSRALIEGLDKLMGETAAQGVMP